MLICLGVVIAVCAALQSEDPYIIGATLFLVAYCFLMVLLEFACN